MRRKWLTLAICLCLSLALLGGCGAANKQKGAPTEEKAPAAQKGDYDEAAAKDAYEKGTCMSCHGGNLEGSAGPSLQTVGKNLSADEIVDIINNGRGGMPALGDKLNDDEKENLAAWLEAHK
ncbi:c-type cytochrome [Numidum massiliense]|uniref:c-type cytochrome n=1 Tax=Numidum massiliense TaxID=1522315 RepID=UPI0006D53177|nr:cytochrome c [Numidum massiliense]